MSLIQVGQTRYCWKVRHFVSTRDFLSSAAGGDIPCKKLCDWTNGAVGTVHCSSALAYIQCIVGLPLKSKFHFRRHCNI